MRARVLLLPAVRLLLILALILLFILLFPTSAGGGSHGFTLAEAGASFRL